MSVLMSVGELARAISAEVHGDSRAGFSSVSTDSRTLASGALFVALTANDSTGTITLTLRVRAELLRRWSSVHWT